MADLPGMMGRARLELGAGIRSRAFGNYIIYFTYEDRTLRIIRIIEAHREVDPEDIVGEV